MTIKPDALALPDALARADAPPVQFPEFALTLARLATLDAEAANLRKWVDGAPAGALITGPDAAAAAELWVKRCALVEKATKAELKRNLAPLDSAWDRVTEAFKPRVEAAAELKARLGRELASYQLRKRDAAAALLMASAEAHLAGDHQRAASTLEAMSALAPNSKPDGVSFRRTWKARIISAGDVPREYCTPSESLLNKSVKEIPEDTAPEPVPGVEFYLETSTTVRTT